MGKATASAAIGQAAIGMGGRILPLDPILTEGISDPSGEMQYPLEMVFNYRAVSASTLDQPPLPGMARWAPLLPPLADISLGEGGTPLLAGDHLADLLGLSVELHLKDESRNPTWSHKDRLNFCAVSSALLAEASGIAVASSGNHGVSAAAYAARAGLPCIVITSPKAPPTFLEMIRAYGARLVITQTDHRWDCLTRVVRETGFRPVSNLTHFHTSAAPGPEGYKTIAFELFHQLGRRAPGAVVVPTGYGELLFGIAKGFDELERLGLTDTMPRIMSAEPEVGAPLATAWRSGRPAVEVEVGASLAASIASPVSGYRGIWAMQRSCGAPLTFKEKTLLTMREALAHVGLFQEMSGVAALAAIKDAVADGTHFEGPIVAILTSGGFKDSLPFNGDHPFTTEAELANMLKEVAHG